MLQQMMRVLKFTLKTIECVPVGLSYRSCAWLCLEYGGVLHTYRNTDDTYQKKRLTSCGSGACGLFPYASYVFVRAWKGDTSPERKKT